jgi:hypothetical protein
VGLDRNDFSRELEDALSAIWQYLERYGLTNTANLEIR